MNLSTIILKLEEVFILSFYIFNIAFPQHITINVRKENSVKSIQLLIELRKCRFKKNEVKIQSNFVYYTFRSTHIWMNEYMCVYTCLLGIESEQNWNETMCKGFLMTMHLTWRCLPNTWRWNTLSLISFVLCMYVDILLVLDVKDLY